MQPERHNIHVGRPCHVSLHACYDAAQWHALVSKAKNEVVGVVQLGTESTLTALQGRSLACFHTQTRLFLLAAVLNL